MPVQQQRDKTSSLATIWETSSPVSAKNHTLKNVVTSPAERIQKAEWLEMYLKRADQMMSINGSMRSLAISVVQTDYGDETLVANSSVDDGDVIDEISDVNVRRRQRVNPSVDDSLMGEDSLNVNDSPIQSLVGSRGKKFEELVELQLKATQNQSKSSESSKPTKRKFLRKGEGLARFTTAGRFRKPKKSVSKSRSTNNNLATVDDKVTPPSVGLRRTNENKVAKTSTDLCEEKESNFHEENRLRASNNFTVESFVKKVDEVEQKRKNECVELKEFEMLEKASEETSFCSTSSIVLRALDNQLTSSPFKVSLGVVKSTALTSINEQQDNTVHCSSLENEKSNSRNQQLTTKFNDEESWSDDGLSNIHNYYTIDDDDAKSLLDETITPPSDTVSTSNQRLVKQPNESLRTTQTNEQFTMEFLEQKSKEMEEEIENLRSQCKIQLQMSQQHKTALEKLDEEKAAFAKYKEEEETRLRKSIDVERQKLAKEKRLHSTYTRNRDQYATKERKEIQKLQLEVEELTTELENQQTQKISCQKRLKDRIKFLEDENEDLRSELSHFQQSQLNDWKFNQAITMKKGFGKLTGASDQHGKAESEGSESPIDDEDIETSDDDVEEDHFDFDPDIKFVSSTASALSVVQRPDGTVQRCYDDGICEVVLSNGTRIESSADGRSVLIICWNGDKKLTLPDHKEIYYFSENQTIQTTYPHGLKVLHFVCGQIEKYHSDGTKEFLFPEGHVQTVFPDKSEKWVLSDGTVIHTAASGENAITKRS